VNLLLLEDDRLFANTLIDYLRLHGYDVDWTRSEEEVLDLSYQNDYLLYLFNLHKLENGLDLLRSLREADDVTPTIIISDKIETACLTKAFIAGANDYIKKPFDLEELLVRIQVRTNSLNRSISYQGYRLYLNNESITYAGEPIYLTPLQNRIFVTMLRNYPHPTIKDELMLLLDKPSDVALRVAISKLKKSIGLDIKNLRGVGYILD
jgi:DNA-binding response OmpR family regulator